MLSPHSVNFPDDPDPLARYRREHEQQEAELARNRRHEERVQQRTQQTMDAQTASWVEWVDARIGEKFNATLDATGEVIGHERGAFQQALRKRDAEIRLLRRELRSLRTEVELKLKLKRELAAARAEVEELRQRSPSFQSELAALREKVEKQEKTISRLRGEQSQLAYAQKQLDAEQQKNRHEVSLTAVQMTVFGQRTEKILRELYENGFNVAEEIQSPPGSIS